MSLLPPVKCPWVEISNTDGKINSANHSSQLRATLQKTQFPGLINQIKYWHIIRWHWHLNGGGSSSSSRVMDFRVPVKCLFCKFELHFLVNDFDNIWCAFIWQKNGIVVFREIIQLDRRLVRDHEICRERKVSE